MFVPVPRSSRARRGGALVPLLLACWSLAGCRHAANGTAPATPEGVPAGTWTSVRIAEDSGHPLIAELIREGDPSPAIAVAVVVEGGTAAAAELSAVVETRLRTAGNDRFSIETDGLGYRIRAAVDGPAQASAFIAALRGAMLTELAAGTPEVAAAARRLSALEHRPLENEALAPIAACIGELRAPPEPTPSPTTPEGLERLEHWRRASHVPERVAFGVVASASALGPLADALRSADPETWPSGSAASPFSTADTASPNAAAAFIMPGRSPEPARIRVAFPLADAAAAFAAFDPVVSPGGRLAAQLAAKNPGFRIVDASFTARPGGACAALSLEVARPIPLALLEVAAAGAAALAAERLEAELAVPRAPDPWRAARIAPDPRDSAALLAWWALSAGAHPRSGAGSRTDGGTPMLVALQLPATLLSDVRRSEAAGGVDATAQRTERILEALRMAARRGTAVDRRVRVESGQGELWMLAASICGTSDEGNEDWGGTALAATAAATSRARSSLRPDGAASDEVEVEPWITADGVGFAAHAPLRPGENGRELASRVGDALGRALGAPAIDANGFAEARAALLGRLGDGPSPEGRAFGAIAEALSSGHPSRLAPFGSWDSLSRGSPDRAMLRLAMVRATPLRVAVLANISADQGEAAARAFASWLPSRDPQSAAVCAPAPPAASPRPGRLEVVLGPAGSGAQAILAIPAPAEGTDGGATASTVAALDGRDGWLARALAAAPQTTSASARLAGAGKARALIIDVRAATPDLDEAVAQIRALVQRLARGAITSADRDRAAAALSRTQTDQSFDPRRRLVDLWRGTEPISVPSVEAWRAFAASWLTEERMAVVLARPRAPSPAR